MSPMQYAYRQRLAILVRQTLPRRSLKAPKVKALNAYAMLKMSSVRLGFSFLWTKLRES